MRKLRNDSTFNRFTYEQRQALETWLFDENLGYAKTLERAQKELGIQTTIASIGRFYRRRALERQAEELMQAQLTADKLNDLPVRVSVASLREAALKLVGKAALQLAAEKPDQPQQLLPFANLLLESERNDLRRSRLQLAQRYFDYEATAACQKELPRVRSYMVAIGHDPNLTEDEKTARIVDVIFGENRSRSSGSGSHESRDPT